MGRACVLVRTWIASETTPGVVALIPGSAERRARSKVGLAAPETRRVCSHRLPRLSQLRASQLGGSRSQYQTSTGWRNTWTVSMALAACWTYGSKKVCICN
eukprot:970526-Rhodomonas_salina.4